MKKNKQPLDDQLSLYSTPLKISWSCQTCVCKDCLMWWSGRCPKGECFDSFRAVINPYDAAHPGEPPRTLWSNWRTDQAFWCRGGTFYPAAWCEHYIKYEGSRIEPCLGCDIQKFQDGYIRCFMSDPPDCHKCYQRFTEMEDEDV